MRSCDGSLGAISKINIACTNDEFSKINLSLFRWRLMDWCQEAAMIVRLEFSSWYERFFYP